jgi:hypothetical protein
MNFSFYQFPLLYHPCDGYNFLKSFVPRVCVLTNIRKLSREDGVKEERRVEESAGKKDCGKFKELTGSGMGS